MSNISRWIVRSTVVALVLFGAAFAQLGWAPGANSAQARTSSAAQSRSIGRTTRPTGTATKTATSTKTPTSTKTATTTKTATSSRTATSTKTATSTGTATSTTPTGGANEAACLNAEEAAFLADINAYRKSKGLGALVATKSLNTASYKHSLDMGINNYFSHTSLNGATFSQRMTAEGYGYATVKGENIAAGYSTHTAVFNAWKASAGHNANMLNPNYKAIGIGLAIVPGSKYTSYWTTDFGGVVDAAAACQ
jgi:uncharacterized protein YkwD